VKGEAFRPILIILVLALIAIGIFTLFPRFKESQLAETAGRERAVAQQARDEARAADARALAGHAWRAANRTWHGAETHFVFRRYEDAAAGYGEAKSEFTSARKVAAAQSLLPEEEREPQETPLPPAPVERPLSQVVASVEQGLARGDQRGLRSADAALAELRRRTPGDERISGLQYRITALRSRLALQSSKRADSTGIITNIEKGLARGDADGLAAAERALAELKIADPKNSRLGRLELQAEALAGQLGAASRHRDEAARLIAEIENDLATGTESSLGQARNSLEELRRRDPGNTRIAGLAAELERRALPPAPLIRGTAAGEQRTIEILPGVTMEFVWVPPGSFLMGSPSGERERGEDEEPQHEVRIGRGFWLGRYEMTQATFQAVTGGNRSQVKGERRPVENVSWNEVQGFIERLNAPLRGSPYRLPTEAEWEYACRAGSTTAFNTGHCISTEQANYDGDRPYAGCYSGRDLGATAEVGRYIANAWGLHDMHGNVCEWCADRYDARYYEVSPATDPSGPSGGDPGRVHRGGGWKGDGDGCRSAHRNGNNPDRRGGHIGFRLVRFPQ